MDMEIPSTPSAEEMSRQNKAHSEGLKKETGEAMDDKIENFKKQQGEEGEDEKFYGEETVNGHKIICDYYNTAGSKAYEMHFPQIDFSSDEARGEGISDSNVYISKDENEAEFVFNKVKKWAETNKEYSIYDLYRRTAELTQAL